MKIEELFGVNKSNLCEKWFSLSALSREVNDKKTALIQKIEKMQKKLFRNKPVLGATCWFVIEVLFLPNNYIGVKMEDGHIENYAILKHDTESDKLTVVIESELQRFWFT